jgi:hypothetical protein
MLHCSGECAVSDFVVVAASLSNTGFKQAPRPLDLETHLTRQAAVVTPIAITKSATSHKVSSPTPPVPADFRPVLLRTVSLTLPAISNGDHRLWSHVWSETLHMGIGCGRQRSNPER